jgi:hypothetical protein
MGYYSHGKHGKHRKVVTHTESTESTDGLLLTQKARKTQMDCYSHRKHGKNTSLSNSINYAGYCI